MPQQHSPYNKIASHTIRQLCLTTNIISSHNLPQHYPPPGDNGTK